MALLPHFNAQVRDLAEWHPSMYMNKDLMPSRPFLRFTSRTTLLIYDWKCRHIFEIWWRRMSSIVCMLMWRNLQIYPSHLPYYYYSPSLIFSDYEDETNQNGPLAYGIQSPISQHLNDFVFPLHFSALESLHHQFTFAFTQLSLVVQDRLDFFISTWSSGPSTPLHILLTFAKFRQQTRSLSNPLILRHNFLNI